MPELPPLYAAHLDSHQSPEAEQTIGMIERMMKKVEQTQGAYGDTTQGLHWRIALLPMGSYTRLELELVTERAPAGY